MTEFKSNINRGILSGFEVDEEKAKVVEELAEKLAELDNGVLDPEEETLATLFGAEAKPKDVVEVKDIIADDAGQQIADHGILTGVEVNEEMAEQLADVVETIESLEEYEKPISTGEKPRDDSEMNNLGEALAVLMGVEPQAKGPDEI